MPFLALVVFLMAACSSHASEQEIPAPKLECAEVVHDFGAVDGSAPVSHSFKIRNAGDADLVFKKVHAPCGCTTFQLENKILAPGATMDFPVTLSLQGRKGPQQKSVYIETNDRTTPTLQLTLRGNVGSTIEFKPPVMVLRKDPRSGEICGEVLVRQTERNPLDCLEAVSTEGRTKISSSPLPGGDGFLLRASASPGLAPGQHTDRIELKIGGAEDATKFLDALILVPSGVVCAPTVLRLDANAAPPVSRTIMALSPGGTSFAIAGVETPHPGIKVVIEQLASDRARIVLENIKPSRELDGSIVRIRTKGSGDTILEVPISVGFHEGEIQFDKAAEQ